VVHRCVFDKDT